MRDKDNGSKKRARKNLVNIISKLTKQQLDKSTDDECIENEESVLLTKEDNKTDSSIVALVEPPQRESNRRSKRKPEKTVKSVSEQRTIEVPVENLTIVEAVLSDDDFEDLPEHEEDNVQAEEKIKKKKKKKEKNDNNVKEKTGHLKAVNCTSCNKNIPMKSGKLCRHPDLNTIMCKNCYKFYSSGKFTKDEYGVEEFCRWCADGGALICCDFCEKAFCKKCVRRNLGKSKLLELLEGDENDKWSCFCCDPAPISSMIKMCNRVMRMLEEEKDHHTPYKDKKGREIIQGPNRSERRNILTTLSGKQTMKSETNSTKKTYSKRFENRVSSPAENNVSTKKNRKVEKVAVKKDKTVVTPVEESEDDFEILEEENSEDDETSNSRKKGKGVVKIEMHSQEEIFDSDSDLTQRKIIKKKQKNGDTNSSSSEELCRSKKQRGDKKRTVKSKSGKKRISEELSDSDATSNSKKKRKDVVKTEVNSHEEISSSDSDVPQKKRIKKKQKSDDTNSSSSEELSRSKKSRREKKRTEKSKSGRKRIESDSSDAFVQTKHGKKSKANTKAVTSSDEESDQDEPTYSSEQESSDGSIKKKRKAKNKRRSVSSESDVEGSSRKQRKKKNLSKGIKVGKWRFRRRRGRSDDSDSDDASNKENVKKSKSKKVAKKKKGKVKRKRNEDDDDDESDEEDASPSKKGRKKIRKILDNDKLAEATRHARQLEEERRQRLLKRTESTSFEKPDTVDLKEVVLEYKADGKTPLVEVDDDLVKHLKPHQVEGVKFMYDCTIESVERWRKKEEGGGCILAHVMGLGKTLQVVALIHTLYKSDLIELRRVLVVCPLNTVLNWQAEFEKWLSVDERMDVYVLNEAKPNNWHRADMMKSWMNYGGILIMGYTMYRNISQCLRVRSKSQKKIFKECLVDPGPELVVCDEGHVLRNCKSAISVAMNGIKTKRRIVLTGTPLQNNLVEYHCMVSFVKPNLLGTLKEFSNSFIRPIANGQCADSTPLDVRLMKRRCHVLHKMLEGCVQRKDYAEIARFLPPKFEYVIKIRLSAKQIEIYRYYLQTFLNTTDDKFKGRGGSLFSDYQALMRIWTHPWSLKLETRRQIENFVDTDDSLKDFVVESDEESTVSSEEMSWTSDSSGDNRGKGREHWKSSSEEEESEGDSSEPEVANNYKHKRRTGKEPGKKETAKKVKADPYGPSTSSATATNAVGNDDDDSKEVKPVLNGESSTNKEVNGVTMVSSTSRSGEDPTQLVEEEEWYDKFLTTEDATNVNLGSKIVLLLEILADAAALEEKVLVFSHSLIALDVIEMALGGGEIGGNTEDWCRGCDYFRMDGSTSAQMRKRWADIFNDEENKAARLFLISTRAGGLGINLVGASRVIVFDISWNPSHDVQSIFRAYRFGQNKPVFVYRFIAQGTMEEKIYDRQVTKLSMSQRVVDEHQIDRHFNANDLAELYRFEPDVLEDENEERPTPAVPKDAILAELINRLYPKWIVKYHEHDSLLQNRPEEELTEAERKEAWEHWELEKQGALNSPPITAERIQQLVNDVNFQHPNTIIIDATGPNPNIRTGPNPNIPTVPNRNLQNKFTFGGPRTPAPMGQNVATFAGVQRPANYQQLVLEEQRRRLFEMETQRRAREQLLHLKQGQEKQRLAQEAKQLAEQQQQRIQQQKLREQQQKLREQQQKLREQQEQRLREQQLRAQEQLRRQQQQQRQRQQQNISQQFLQQLLGNRNAYVTQQVRPGNPNQSVYQVVVNDDMNNDMNNAPFPRRTSRRSPPRIVELPPDA